MTKDEFFDYIKTWLTILLVLGITVFAIGLYLHLLTWTQKAQAETYDNLDVRGLNAVHDRSRKIDSYQNSDVPHVRKSVQLQQVAVEERPLSEAEIQAKFSQCVGNIKRTKHYQATLDTWAINPKAKSLAWQEGLELCQDEARLLKQYAEDRKPGGSAPKTPEHVSQLGQAGP